MDTRNKILTGPEAVVGRPLAVVTGYFDVLRAEHARELAQVRSGTRGSALLVVVSQGSDALLPLAARAELVAALRVVDYVLTADDGDVDALIETLKPTVVVRLETEDAGRVRRLKEHVQQRQA
ncbi:MAG TPA: hypothetical protein VG456_11090 [Candidatus Sulfopaludibacter sp.]|jgi:bifunctional ADP-heptose synthase (sugar kinase/adenylyltransferase)|nr:hypothetical protein [Candidatus Sulfopaludibacter sp.]